MRCSGVSCDSKKHLLSQCQHSWESMNSAEEESSDNGESSNNEDSLSEEESNDSKESSNNDLEDAQNLEKVERTVLSMWEIYKRQRGRWMEKEVEDAQHSLFSMGQLGMFKIWRTIKIR